MGRDWRSDYVTHNHDILSRLKTLYIIISLHRGWLYGKEYRFRHPFGCVAVDLLSLRVTYVSSKLIQNARPGRGCPEP